MIKEMTNALLQQKKDKQILNMYADMNTDQITISYHFLPPLLKSSHKPQSVNTCKRPEELPPSSAFLVGWNAVTGSTELKFSLSECVLFCTVLMEHLQPSGPQHAPCHKNSPPALGPTRPIFCLASGRCACCV